MILMSEEEFTELVNLYLDGEISAEDSERLRAELSADCKRKARFLARRRLHEATGLALDPKGLSNKLVRRSSRGRRDSRAISHRRRSKASLRGELSAQGSSGASSEHQAKVAPLPRWVLGSGLVACLLVGLLLLVPMFKDSLGSIAIPGIAAEDFADDGPSDEILAGVRASDLERFARIRQEPEPLRTSLVAQMRLMGLRPEHTPVEKQFRTIDTAILKPQEGGMSRAELLSKLQALKPIPEPKLLREENPYRRATDTQPGLGADSFDVYLLGN